MPSYRGQKTTSILAVQDGNSLPAVFVSSASNTLVYTCRQTALRGIQCALLLAVYLNKVSRIPQALSSMQPLTHIMLKNGGRDVNKKTNYC
jgi:hypothetical protein